MKSFAVKEGIGIKTRLTWKEFRLLQPESNIPSFIFLPSNLLWPFDIWFSFDQHKFISVTSDLVILPVDVNSSL